MENQEIIDKLIESENYIKQVNLVNIKLAHGFKLLCEFHLTTEEKVQVAEDFDMARDESEVIALYDRKAGELKGEFPDENLEYRWSPKFARDMMSYIKHFKEYDPFVEIRGFFEILRNQFNMGENAEYERVINKNEQKANTIEESIKQNVPKTRHAIESIDIMLKDLNA